MIGDVGQPSTGDDSLFGVHASLRLVSLLRRSQMLEENDDLLDAWNEKKEAIGRVLLEKLIQFAGNTPNIATWLALIGH